MDESRKIIKQGHNTLTVTLPSKWIKTMRLSAGDEIFIKDHEETLIFSAKRAKSKLSTEFNIDGFDIPTIWKYYMAAYRNGYDEFVITFQKDLQVSKPYLFLVKRKYSPNYVHDKVSIYECLQSMTERFIGMEIVEQGPTFIRVREMAQVSSEEFDNAFRRVFFLIGQMVDGICQAVMHNDVSHATRIQNLDINLDKFQDYCLRILNKTGFSTPQVKLQFSMLYFLEQIGDELKNIASLLIYDTKQLDFEKLRPVMENVRLQWTNYHKFHFAYDQNAIHDLIERDIVVTMAPIRQNKQYVSTVAEIFHHLRIVMRFINLLIELRIQKELKIP